MDDVVRAPDSPLSVEALADAIAELSGHLNAADRRWLSLIAEFDRREGWASSGARSCAHWLNWKCGLDVSAAREKLRVAHALERLPLIGAAMGRGELSYSKVRALTRVALPATGAYPLSIALAGTARPAHGVRDEHQRRAERAALRHRRAARVEPGHAEAPLARAATQLHHWRRARYRRRSRVPEQRGGLLRRLRRRNRRTRVVLRCEGAGICAADVVLRERPPVRERADRLGHQCRNPRPRVAALRCRPAQPGAARADLRAGWQATLPPRPAAEPAIIEDPTFVRDDESASRGAANFMPCALCHGNAAIAAGHAPDLRRSPIPLSSDVFAKIVRGGALEARGMPKYPEYTDRRIEDLRHYIRAQAWRGRTGESARISETSTMPGG